MSFYFKQLQIPVKHGAPCHAKSLEHNVGLRTQGLRSLCAVRNEDSRYEIAQCGDLPTTDNIDNFYLLQFCDTKTNLHQQLGTLVFNRVYLSLDLITPLG